MTLNPRQERALEDKLDRLQSLDAARPAPGQPLEPEPYTEVGASRALWFSEEELNALLANNTDLARRLAIDLSDDLVSATLLVPVDPDFPILGGHTLKCAPAWNSPTAAASRWWC